MGKLRSREDLGEVNMGLKCPYCSVSFHEQEELVYQNVDSECGWSIISDTCPSCKKLVLYLRSHPVTDPLKTGRGAQIALYKVLTKALVKPRSGQRALPPEVPEIYAKDFREAVAVCADSPRASAALSRFCLQKLLRSEAKVKNGDLANEIQEVIDSGKLPSAIAESIDAVRNIGNFAAHPNKSKVSGEITEVEPHEAEWTLDVLEALFDYYLVQPIQMAKKRDALNQKLKDMGKPPMK